jgi:hypothetical protein
MWIVDLFGRRDVLDDIFPSSQKKREAKYPVRGENHMPESDCRMGWILSLEQWGFSLE